MRSDSLRIGIVCYPTYGGSGVMATELGLHLVRRGHEVHFICYSVPLRLREYHRNLYYHVVDVLPYPLFEYTPYDLALASTLVDIASRHDLDLVHVHYAVPHSISAFLARTMMGDAGRFRIVTTLHGTDITIVGAQKSYRTATRFGIEASDCVTAVSRHLARATHTLLGRRVPIQVIPNFVNLERFRPAEDRSRGRRRLAAPDEAVLLHVSNFRPVKRVPDVVRVFARVLARVPCRLILLGDGPEMRRVVSLVDRLGLNDRVTFFGPIDDVEAVLPYADVFLLPTGAPGESFGLAALESMACGIPVVGTRLGGLPEVVADGQTGFLCEPGDLDAMAARVLELLEDRATWKRLSAAARARAETCFHPAQVTSRYERLYRTLLSEPPAAATRCATPPPPGEREAEAP